MIKPIVWRHYRYYLSNCVVDRNDSFGVFCTGQDRKPITLTFPIVIEIENRSFEWCLIVNLYKATHCGSWWRHKMETFSALLALCPGNSHRPVTRSFAIFFDPRLKERLSKQSRRRWFETPSRSLSGDYDVTVMHSLSVPTLRCVRWSVLCLAHDEFYIKNTNPNAWSTENDDVKIPKLVYSNLGVIYWSDVLCRLFLFIDNLPSSAYSAKNMAFVANVFRILYQTSSAPVNRLLALRPCFWRVKQDNSAHSW